MKTKSFSKLLVVMVIVALVISAVSGINLMAETFEYDLSAAQDGSIMGTLDRSTGEFIIEGTGEMLNYTSYSNRPYHTYAANYIRKVTISEGITNIPDYAFYNCSLITEISIPSTVTTIGAYAFYKNSALTELCLGNVNKIGDNAIYGCQKITNFEITAELTEVSSKSIFPNGSMTTAAKKAKIPTSNIYLVETFKALGYTVEETSSSIEKSYDNWPAFATVEIGYPTPSDVKAYYNQYNTSLIIKGKGAIMDNARKSLPTYDSSKARDNTITSIVIEEGITEIGTEAFNNFIAAKTYELPSTLTKIGDSAFRSNSVLTSMEIPNNVTSIGASAFESCAWITTVDMPDNLETIGARAFAQMTSLQAIDIPEGVTFIGENAFYYDYNVEEITILQDIIDIGKGAFSLNETGGVTVNINANYIYLIEGFEGLGYTVNKIGETTKEKWSTYPSNMIVEVGANNPSDVKVYYNEYSKTIDVVGTGAIIDKTTSASSFMNMSSTPTWENATTINIHEGITHIGSMLFYNMSDDHLDNVDAIYFPQSLQSIGSKAFAYMNWGKVAATKKVPEIIIPENVTEIGQEAFVRSGVDTFVLLTNDNQTVGTQAFGSSDEEKTIYLYRANEGAIEVASTLDSDTKVYFLDDAATSGTTENGIKWTYDPSTKTLTFEGNGDIPTYSPESSAPWYGTGIAYNPSSYVFGSGITGVGSAFAGMGGSRIDYGNGGASGWGGAGITVYGPSSLGGAISSALPNATIKDVSEIEGEEKTGIEIFVNNNEVDFPDAQPFISGGQILAPLRFIEQDLSAKVHWVQETQEVIIDIVEWKGTENERQVQVILEVGGTTMKVNGTEYTEEDLGVGVAVLLKDNRCFLPGQAIVKAWESVKFSKDYSNAPTYYADYYTIVDYENRNTDALPEGDEIVDTEELPELTPENEEELLNGVGNNFDTAIIVSAEASLFQVTVPIRVDVEMDADGNISTGSGYTVDNECPLGPVVIEKIKVVSKSTWSIEDFNADYKNMKASSNKIGLSINGAAVQTNGTLTLNESLRSVIRNKESKALSFEAKLPAQRTAIQDNALGIVFTIDFDKAE